MEVFIESWNENEAEEIELFYDGKALNIIINDGVRSNGGFIVIMDSETGELRYGYQSPLAWD